MAAMHRMNTSVDRAGGLEPVVVELVLKDIDDVGRRRTQGLELSDEVLQGNAELNRDGSVVAHGVIPLG